MNDFYNFVLQLNHFEENFSPCMPRVSRPRLILNTTAQMLKRKPIVGDERKSLGQLNGNLSGESHTENRSSTIEPSAGTWRNRPITDQDRIPPRDTKFSTTFSHQQFPPPPQQARSGARQISIGVRSVENRRLYGVA